MSTTSDFRAIGIPLVIFAAAAGLPVVLRTLLHESVAGPISGAHVLLAQVAFLVLAAESARLVARTVEAQVTPWRLWARDASSVAGAVVLIIGTRLALGHRDVGAIDLSAATLVLTAPIVEEIVYRGLLPELLAPLRRSSHRTAPRIWVAVMSSAAFAAAHAGGNGYTGTSALRAFSLSFGCGLAFHLLRDTTGGLAAPMVAHSGVNAMTLRAMG